MGAMGGAGLDPSSARRRSGQRVFQEWLSTPVQSPRQMRQEFQLKLYFAQRESQELWAHLLDLQRTACQHWLTNQQSLAGEAGEAHSYAWLVEQYRIGQIQAMLDWLEFCATHQV